MSIPSEHREPAEIATTCAACPAEHVLPFSCVARTSCLNNGALPDHPRPPCFPSCSWQRGDHRAAGRGLRHRRVCRHGDHGGHDDSRALAGERCSQPDPLTARASGQFFLFRRDVFTLHPSLTRAECWTHTAEVDDVMQPASRSPSSVGRERYAGGTRVRATAHGGRLVTTAHPPANAATCCFG